MKKASMILGIVSALLLGVLILLNIRTAKEAMTGELGYEGLTETYKDTLQDNNPQERKKATLGYRDVRVAKTTHRAGAICEGDTVMDETEETGERIGEETDSMTIRLPIEQSVYETEDYTAYVSGVEARLDSISVYVKRERVKIKEPPKRWHIGPAIGIGYTPHGIAPYIGVSITYSVISF